MNSQPLVSIVIPNYNHARYLEQRLDSVFNQTYQNFEVIFLDDCSTDNSLEIIEKYKDNPHLSRIVVNEVNSGSPFKQWDKGIGFAKGELIWIAESDDYCELTLLKELVEAFLRHSNTVLAFSSYVQVFDDGTALKERERKVQCYKGKRFVSHWMSLFCVVRNASGAIFSKKAFEHVPNTYMTYKACGDYLFWTQIAEQGVVAFVPKNLTYFRIHSNSVTTGSFASGNEAKESRKVLDYIRSRYRISLLQEAKIYAFKDMVYVNGDYLDDASKERSLQAWGIDGRDARLGRFFLKISNKVQQHFGILI
ncbi:MAG: glycosyltransferase family 2 protein [Bacteroidales bacterium]|nr:glycosyltransferase family 2 protein [Bacteroidales bacterium]